MSHGASINKDPSGSPSGYISLNRITTCRINVLSSFLSMWPNHRNLLTRRAETKSKSALLVCNLISLLNDSGSSGSGRSPEFMIARLRPFHARSFRHVASSSFHASCEWVSIEQTPDSYNCSLSPFGRSRDFHKCLTAVPPKYPVVGDLGWGRLRPVGNMGAGRLRVP